MGILKSGNHLNRDSVNQQSDAVIEEEVSPDKVGFGDKTDDLEGKKTVPSQKNNIWMGGDNVNNSEMNRLSSIDDRSVDKSIDRSMQKKVMKGSSDWVVAAPTQIANRNSMKM